MNKAPVYGDNPIVRARDDLLDRSGAIRAISAVLLDPDTDTPLTVGIFGDWGSGKTSFMRMLQEAIPAEHITVWLDAWRYTNQERSLWRALLGSVIDALRNNVDTLVSGSAKEREIVLSELAAAETSLYRSFEYETAGRLSVNWRGALPLALEAGLAFLPAGKSVYDSLRAWLSEDGEKVASLIERERATVYKQQVQSLDQFQDTFRSLVDRYLGPAGSGPGRRLLVIFVDDLDRCLPGAALSALEALKVFLDARGCLFVLGMDSRLITRGIAARLGDDPRRHEAGMPAVDPAEYLEKIIQVPFALPSPGSPQIEQLINGLFATVEPVVLESCRGLIVAGVVSNPRTVRRTLNVLRLTLALHRVTSAADVQLITKLVVLQTCYAPVYRRIQDTLTGIRALEAACWRAAPGTPDDTDLERYPQIRDMIRTGAQFGDIADGQLRQLMTSVLRTYAPPR
jgi:hypothetical protein